MAVYKEKLEDLNDLNHVTSCFLEDDYLFRGEPIDYGKTRCSPSISRPDVPKEIRKKEKEYYKELKDKFLDDYFGHVKEEEKWKNFGAGRWLSLFQHHGYPTRLIDWTLDIKVALSFLINGWKYDCTKRLEQLENSGLLYVLDYNKCRAYEIPIRKKIIRTPKLKNYRKL